MVITLLSFVILAFTTYDVCMSEMATTECGTIKHLSIMPRILMGEKTNRGEWPFLAALFKVKEEENEFFCGGSLISSQHVLTAAHCIQDKGVAGRLHPRNLSVLLGACNLTSKTEMGVQQRDVEKIYIHPDWDYNSEQYDADLAVLLLNKVVVFTDYIRPVCIPVDDTKIDDVIGSVVGWGLTEIGTKPNTEFIKHAYVAMLPGLFCLTKYPDLAVLFSLRTFCGLGKDGNVNRGDSGGGFYVQNDESVYVQHGIVSSVRTNPSGYVDPDAVVVYTNVLKFKNWIMDTVRQLNLECVFEYSTSTRKYTCYIYDVLIQSDNSVVSSFSGSHLDQKTDEDVEQITFYNGTMFFIPSGIGQIFKNLKIMVILRNLATKRIKRSDFKSLENLISFNIDENELTTLDNNCFRDLQKLEVLKIANNRLTEIEEGTFEVNTKLKEVYLFGNSLEVLPRHLFRNNSLLEVVSLFKNSLKVIDESTFETNIKLKNVYLHDNYLELLPRNLLQNNLLLETINLHGNSLKDIDESTFATNIKLKGVALHINKLEVLPTNLFRNNSLLEVVYLYKNYLKNIDESIFATNINLRHVYMYMNILEDLPRHLFQNNLLLRYVNLRNSSLKTIDELTFETNINLKKVNLYGNKLEVLPRHLFRNNLLLRVVCLQNNSLKIIDESTFETNIKLKVVFLQGNKLEVLPKHLFQNNTLLSVVDLGGNSLRSIDESTFETNINLDTVALYENKLEYLPTNLFRNNLLLERVDFRSNSLKLIETKFNSLTNIHKIYFHDNICINTYYDPMEYLGQHTNLTEFENIISANCSSSNNS